MGQGQVPKCVLSLCRYNSNHLQLAAGVAVAASNMSIQQVVKKYLLTPYNMTDSYYYGGACPDFAGDLLTTGADYERYANRSRRSQYDI